MNRNGVILVALASLVFFVGVTDGYITNAYKQGEKLDMEVELCTSGLLGKCENVAMLDNYFKYNSKLISYQLSMRKLACNNIFIL